MAWKVEFDPAAERELNKLDPPIIRRILTFLNDTIAPQTIPVASVKHQKVRVWVNSGSIEWAITALSAASKTALFVSSL